MNEGLVYRDLLERRNKKKQNYKIGDFVRTADENRENIFKNEHN